MFNSGQCCCGIERLYVARASMTPLSRRPLPGSSKTYKLGNPLDPETTIGPMANVRFADEVRAQTARRLPRRARADRSGAVSADDGGAYLMPQILVDVTHDMRVMRDESFGPVVGIMPVKDDEEALALMNDCQFGLTASLWTNDPSGPRASAPDRDRHRVHEPRRLSRPGAVLDRLQGHRPRRLAVGHRLPQPDPSQILPSEKETA
jgi:acyl-CoA reductase-like NAD-dependent aldehyde dehydrogenase